MGDTPLLGNSYLRSRSSQYKCNIAHLRRTRRRQDDLVRRCKYFPSSYTRDTSGESHESFFRLKANRRFWIGNAVRYGQDNSVFANMNMYWIENMVCQKHRRAMFLSEHRLNIASLRIGKDRIVKNIASLRKVKIPQPYSSQVFLSPVLPQK